MDSLVNSEWLASRLLLPTSSEELKVLDIRSIESFSISRIKGSAHLQVPSLILRRLQKGKNNGAGGPLKLSSLLADAQSRDLLERHAQSAGVSMFTVVLYEHTSPLIRLLAQNFAQLGFEVKVLSGTFESFQASYPDLCEACVKPCSELRVTDDSLRVSLSNLRISVSQPATPSKPVISPGFKLPPVARENSTSTRLTEIMPFLYLGDRVDASNREALKRNGINFILNVTPDLPNVFEDDKTVDIEYLQIPIDDQYSEEISRFFPRTIKFIESARSQGRGILVHCLAGISRSVTVVVAYLMAAEGLSLNEAFERVRQCKSNVSPNFNFMGQLLEYEKQLSKERSSLANHRNISSYSDSTLSFKPADNAPPPTLVQPLIARTLEL